MSYHLLDSGEGRKLERFGEHTLIRPASGAIWKPMLSEEEWHAASSTFSREGKGGWLDKRPLPESWNIEVGQIRFQLKRTNFGHLGIFPEQKPQWRWIAKQVARFDTPPRILNLFAYSGGSTLAAAAAGAKVTHVDASKGMIAWARENAALNGLQKAPIRWLADDVFKYLKRALRRGERYEGIILDPPSFGRGAKKELFKIEEDLTYLLTLCIELLSEEAKFLLLSCHTTGYTELTLQQLLTQKVQREGVVESGPMLLEGPFALPSGIYARWVR